MNSRESLRDPVLVARLRELREFAGTVRASEYLITSACNVKCTGCWYYEGDFDKATKEEKDLIVLREFISAERERGINSALLIGGEPSLFPQRIAAYVERMPYVTISTNGLKALPRQGFENVAVAISLFAGGPMDDELRAIKPNGKRFTGLFDKALDNYRGDDRAWFVYAVTENAVEHIEPTIQRIADAGLRVSFNFYSAYGESDPLRRGKQDELRDEMLRMLERFPDIIQSTPTYIEAIVTGKSPWGGSFGYDVCPSISSLHPENQVRIANGNPILPKFNAWAPDLKTVNFCCTSGKCEECRDSQAVWSWLMCSPHRFAKSGGGLAAWADVCESYWRQFIWAKRFWKPGRAPVAPPVKVRPIIQIVAA